MRRLFALGAIACGIAGLGGSAAAMAAPAAPTAACNGTSGVTVVVDFGSLGGGTQVRCAPGDPSSGLQALIDAGFTYGFHPQYPGLVCVIDQKPDPCNGAPSNAYWAYHHGNADGSWSYSNEGAGTYDPKPGSYEGWAFGAGRKPSATPPRSTTTTAPPTSSPAPQPSITSRPTGGGGGTSATTTPAGTAPDSTASDETATTAADTTSTTDTTESTDTSATDETTTTATGDDGERSDRIAGASADDETALAAVEDDGGGSGVGAYVAGVVIVALGVGAFLERRRRAPA